MGSCIKLSKNSPLERLGRFIRAGLDLRIVEIYDIQAEDVKKNIKPLIISVEKVASNIRKTVFSWKA